MSFNNAANAWGGAAYPTKSVMISGYTSAYNKDENIQRKDLSQGVYITPDFLSLDAMVNTPSKVPLITSRGGYSGESPWQVAEVRAQLAKR